MFSVGRGEVGINSLSLDKPTYHILASYYTRPRFLKKVCGGWCGEWWLVGGWVVESDFSVKLEPQA